MIRYYKLLDLLKRREISKEQFQQLTNLPLETVTKLFNNEYVSLEIIDHVCNKLHCTPSDIINFTPDIK